MEPLSGGLKRRLTIARSLINEPEILLLDEPTTGLDPQARHVVWDRLFRLKQQGVTLVLTTHYMDEAEQLCDRLVVMDAGRIAAEGSPRELIERYSTPEVLELRFDPAVHENAAEKLAAVPAQRREVAGRPGAALRRGRGRRAGRGPRARPGPADLAGPAQHAGRRVPAADRPPAGGLMAVRTQPGGPAVGLPGRDRAGRAPWDFAVRQLRFWLTDYRRTWRGSIISTVLQPLLYLGAMGLGLGTLVDKHGTAALGQVSYLVFLAPGLLAASAMGTGVGESTYPVLGSVKWNKTYQAAVSSPLRPADLFHGHLLFVGLKLTMTSSVFLAVAAAFGAIRSPWAILALPVAVLTGLAFTAPIEAWTVTRTKDTSLAVVYRFGLIPLFLFSGTFFPVTQLPAWIRPIAYLTPLWHGVALCRELCLGIATVPSAFLHVGYLLVVLGAGIIAGDRTYTRRLYV